MFRPSSVPASKLPSAMALLLAASAAAVAQTAPVVPPPPPPLTAQPQDAAPPPPAADPAVPVDPDLEPQVTITRRGTDTVEEVRVGGRISYLKVTPRIGRPYYLVPTSSGTQFLRYDSLDFGLRPPMWQLFSW